MGQCNSTMAGGSHPIGNEQDLTDTLAGVVSLMEVEEEEEEEEEDQSSIIPNECLACIFQKLGQTDRNNCTLVCKRWHWVDSETRQRLSLKAHLDSAPVFPTLLRRFTQITKLALRCERKRVSINDEALYVVGSACGHLRKLKLKGCKQLTDEGIERFSKACSSPLRKISCGSCSFGSRGVNSLLSGFLDLEDLTVKRLRGLLEGPHELVGPGSGGKIRRLCLKELFNAQLFGPLIAGSKNLHTLMLCKNSGNWDKLLEIVAEHVPDLVELHVEKLQFSDRSLQAAASRWSRLEVLYVVKTPECTDYGLARIAEGCTRLKRIHLDGWKSNRIGDQGLIAVAKKCADLQELVLIGIHATVASLGLIAAKCPALERLAVCGSNTMGDTELSSVASKCLALKRLCIKSCPITDKGMLALATGCPQLIKVKVKKCKLVTNEIALILQAHRPSLIVSLDSDSQPVSREPNVAVEPSETEEISTLSRQRSSLARVKLAFFAGGNFIGTMLRLPSRRES